MSPNIFRTKLPELLKSPLSKLNLSVITDLYKGVDHQYVLFWEDNVPSLYDHVSYNGSSRLIRLDDSTQTSKLPYLTTVFVAGPQVFQRIFRIDVDKEAVSEWIINHRHEIWPSGIDDETLDFSYTQLQNSSHTDLYFCFINRETISLIESYCEMKGLIPARILPRASLMFDGEAFGQVKRDLVRGELIEKISQDNGSRRIYAQKSDIDYVDNPGLSKGDESGIDELDIAESLKSYDKGTGLEDINLSSERSTALRFSFLHKAFRYCVYAMLSMLIILVTSNIYLSVKESQSSGILTELEILRANSELLENKVSVLEDELTVYSNLSDRHSTYGKIISGLAQMSPDSLWYRYLEISDNLGGGSTVALKGYSVNRSQAALLAHALESLEGVTSVDIVSLNHITENIPDDIPFKYQNNLYRYSLKLEVKY
ncbi:MAG: hypothetical protein GY839_02835 [candidate division Zixibacteria bacterium]|nr:hypothetical protein [candidate division Zixibacteria bacterium]